MNPNFSRSRLTLLVLACCLALTACRTRLKTTVESAPPPPPPPAEPAEKVGTPPARAGRVEPKEPPAAVLPRTAPVAPPPKAPPETPTAKIGVVPVPAPPPLLSTPGKPINDVTTGVAPRGIPPKDVPAAPAPFVQPAIQTPLPGVPPVDANRPPGAKAPWPAAVFATPAGSVPGKPPEVLSLSRSTPGTPEMVRGPTTAGSDSTFPSRHRPAWPLDQRRDQRAFPWRACPAWKTGPLPSARAASPCRFPSADRRLGRLPQHPHP